MQRCQRDLTDVEMIDALEEIIDISIRCYDEKIRKEFEDSSRCAQLGADVLNLLYKKQLIEMCSDIGYEVLSKLLEMGIIKTGRYEAQEKLKEIEGGAN